MGLKLLTIILLFFCLANAALCQDSAKAELAHVISSVNKASDSLGIEKLYLQTDKSIYTAGDTLWFKAYLFDAGYLTASSKSGLVYVEIADDSNSVMKRIMLPVYGGRTFGQIQLKESEMPAGNYILRAYTNWMRNFGENYIFKKYFYIGTTATNQWLNFLKGIENRWRQARLLNRNDFCSK